MNLINKITFSRIIFAVFFYFLFLSENQIANYFALFFFSLATISDFYDGFFARKYNIVTKLGQLLDPLADKLLVLCALLAFVQKDIIPGWMLIVIFAREFLVMGIRIIASSSGEVMPARDSGKYKTVVQLEMIIISTVLYLFRKTCSYFFIPVEEIFNLNIFLDKSALWILKSGPYYLILSSVIVTVLSGIEYWNQNKKSIDG